MRNEERGHSARIELRHEQPDQRIGGRGVERNERLVEQQQFGFDRQRARQRDAAREAQRQFAGEMPAMLGQAERGEQRPPTSPVVSPARPAARLSSTLRQGSSRGS